MQPSPDTSDLSTSIYIDTPSKRNPPSTRTRATSTPINIPKPCTSFKQFDDFTDLAPLKTIQPKQNSTWIPDECVSRCYSCNVGFGLLVRRHHCRLCGRIFCYTCSNYWIDIPKVIQCNLPESPPIWWAYGKLFGGKRMCRDCHHRTRNIVNVKGKIEVFLLLGEYGITLREWITCSKVSRNWQQITSYLISMWRNIQYRTPYQNISPWEKQALKINRRYIHNHNKYYYHYIITYGSLLEKPEFVPCGNLLCGRNCNEVLEPWMCFSLLKKNGTSNASLLREFAVNNLARCDPVLLIPYVMHLVEASYLKIVFVRVVIAFACINREFAHAYYWQARCDHSDYCRRLLVALPEQTKYEIETSEYFIMVLMDIIKSKSIQERKEICERIPINAVMCLPGSPNITVRKILWDKIIVKDSSSMPLVIPCECNGHIEYIMWKNDDVRKDAIVMAIINLLKVFGDKENLNITTKCYTIIPLDATCGLITIVPDSETLYMISRKQNMSLQNYIIENNPTKTSEYLRNKFIASCAFASVVSLLLGLGDRHLDNIMITREGILFHIDFEYVLGDEPMGKITMNSIKLTSQIVDAMGGQSSEYYKEFKNICGDLYNCARRHLLWFYPLLVYLSKHNKIPLKRLHRHIDTRFIPGESYEEAKFIINEKLDQETRNRFFDGIMDGIHHISRSL